MLLQGHGLLLNGLAAVVVLAVVLLLRLLCVMPRRRRGGEGGGWKGKRTGATASTLVVMGSGGHTTEMLGLVKVRPEGQILHAGPQPASVSHNPAPPSSLPSRSLFL